MIIEELERKIHDFQTLPFPEYTKRSCTINKAPGMISTIIGARRVGKSIRALQLIDEAIVEKKIPSKKHICYLDFDNPILSRITAEQLKLIQIHFLKLNPGFSLKTPLLFIFDEIHKIINWEDFVIELSRNPKWKVYVTGSSSKFLHADLSTTLRGKALSTIIYPFDFSEFLLHKNLSNLNKSTENIAAIKRFLEEYLQWGAYPAIAGLTEKLKEILLREYFDTMILKDIIERYNVSKPKQCIFLLRYLLSNTAKPFTIESAYKALKNYGFKTSKDSIHDYIDWAVDSFLCYKVPIFSRSLKEQARNYSKIYCIDWALANVNNWVWNGYLTRSLENLVFIHLIRKDYRVNYYLTKEKRQEIDFIVTNPKGLVENLIQVCYSIDDEETFKREIEPLLTSMKYFNQKNSQVITLTEEKAIKTDFGEIEVIPLWKWLLK